VRTVSLAANAADPANINDNAFEYFTTLEIALNKFIDELQVSSDSPLKELLLSVVTEKDKTFQLFGLNPQTKSCEEFFKLMLDFKDKVKTAKRNLIKLEQRQAAERKRLSF
jgi:hypothetical protein